jgi:hypothetical protein
VPAVTVKVAGVKAKLSIFTVDALAATATAASPAAVRSGKATAGSEATPTEPSAGAAPNHLPAGEHRGEEILIKGDGHSFILQLGRSHEILLRPLPAVRLVASAQRRRSATMPRRRRRAKPASPPRVGIRRCVITARAEATQS